MELKLIYLNIVTHGSTCITQLSNEREQEKKRVFEKELSGHERSLVVDINVTVIQTSA